MNCETLIIGAGFAGLSTAAHLAEKDPGKIIVVEQDEKLGGHSSGRNAGMIRQAISDPVLVQLACEGRGFLSRLKNRGWGDIAFRSIGSLLLAKKDKLAELKHIAQALKSQGADYEWWSAQEAGGRVPVLKEADFEHALFCPSDAVIEINQLLSTFLEKLKKKKVSVLLGHPFMGIRLTDKGFYVEAGDKKIFARRVVNAAGAWAGIVARKAGALSIPLKAYRRHLFQSAVFPEPKAHWPFVWDLSHDFYFRPQDKGLLLSPCDKILFDASRLQAKNFVETIDPKMEKLLLRKVHSFSKNFGSLRIESKKSGLRTMVPDGRFVIGEDPKLKQFFWVAGLGGHGVTTCFAVGRLAADLILGHKVDPHLKRNLSPGRFK